MISQPLTIIRANKLGKPYVQNTDPSLDHTISVNDIWLNPSEGSFKTWDGDSWEEMQWGASAIMDDCIANRMLANDISASKITTGILQSSDGSVYLNLMTGEAALNNLKLSGEVEGNIIAVSSDGLTRVRVVGKEGYQSVTAGIVFEKRESTSDDEGWENVGEFQFDISDRLTNSYMQNYFIGVHDYSKPSMGYYSGSDDGYVWRSLSPDFLRASCQTFHGLKLMARDELYDDFTNASPVLTAIGNCMSGTAIAVNGICTLTHQMNDVMQIDFDLRVTTAGSGTGVCGISPTLLRNLNSAIPEITPIDGGRLRIFNSSGSLLGSYAGETLSVLNGLWIPSYISNGAIARFDERTLSSGVTLNGTCYGTYSYGE